VPKTVEQIDDLLFLTFINIHVFEKYMYTDNVLILSELLPRSLIHSYSVEWNLLHYARLHEFFDFMIILSHISRISISA